MMAELDSADLTGAGLHKALLFGANLDSAILTGANLSCAKFNAISADTFPWASHKYGDNEYLFPVVQFHGPVPPAKVSRADFTDAILENADIRGVNFESTKGLTADQLKKTVGNSSTTVGRQYNLTLEVLIKELNPVIRGWNNYQTRIQAEAK